MSGSSLMLAAVPLARSSEGSKSGPIGLAIVLLLCVACYFLFKSMSGHLRRVREHFPADATRDEVTPAVPQVVSTEPPSVEPVERPDRPNAD